MIGGPMARNTTAVEAADLLRDTFQSWRERFAAITRAARGLFERRDWAEVQRASARRLDLYGEAVDAALSGIDPILGASARDRETWAAIRAAYSDLIRPRGDHELAETFFNSVTRRLFHTVGVDGAIEFVGATASSAPPSTGVTVTFRRDGPGPEALERLLRRILRHFDFVAGWEDADRDVRLLRLALEHDGEAAGLESIEMALPIFYRGKGAYLVGRAGGRSAAAGAPAGEAGPGAPAAASAGAWDRPFLLALRSGARGIAVDALLLTEDEVSIVFSFARSYFFVEMDRPREIIGFLRSIMPRKPVAELWSAVGCEKHGKTEFFRALLSHLDATAGRFTVAPGQRGMVMAVFTLPGLDVVFKVIRDRFAAPKTVTRDEVRAKYRLVFRHDRAGRLVDAQEFEHLTFDRARFDDALLDELTREATETVRVEGDRVIVSHLYTERRLQPLDLYLRTAPFEAARLAVLDYGQVLRDLAATNIFPGDMLTKNFGVSRHGRLIFYDYDELCLLTDCRFRELPAPRDDWEEGAAEPAFHVGERDIFPEEFRAFLGFHGPLLDAFLAAHGELLGVRFWHDMQERLERGEVIDIYPYGEERRLRSAPA